MMFASRTGRTIASLMLVAVVLSVTLSGWAAFSQARATPAAQNTQAPAGATMPRTITVVGHGTVRIMPDIAIADIGVETSGPNIQDTIAEASTTMAAVLEALTAAGIAEKDIQTAGFNVWADHSISPTPTTEGNRDEAVQEITYYVDNNVRVVMRDIEELGAVIDAAVEAGANSIDGVSFGIDNPEDVASEAREEAVADALARAQELATLNGVEVGEVISVSEIVNQVGIYGMAPIQVMTEGMGGADPFTPGEQEVTMQLQVVYAIR